jgi:hypothetical protein
MKGLSSIIRIFDEEIKLIDKSKGLQRIIKRSYASQFKRSKTYQNIFGERKTEEI